MNITRETIKDTLRTVMAEETEYQTFFKKALEKAGKSIPSMSDEEKKEFFNKIDAAWNAKGEKNEDLKGNQHKLDVDGDGEIEASDLAALRAGKKKDESVNEVAYNDAIAKFNKDLEKNSQVKKIASYYKKPTKMIVKALQPMITVLRYKDKSIKLVSINFTDAPSGPTKVHMSQTYKQNESVNESAGCGCGCGCGGSKMNEEFKSKDSTFEKVYGIFDKKDYFNAKGLAKTQIGNFERALQRNDKGAQQILDKFKGDMEKSKEYIIQVISDQKKQQAFEDYKKFKKAVENILYRPNGNEEYASADFIKSRVHNNSQKYTIALYSSIRNKKFTNYKDIHADVDSLMTESVNEGKKRFRQQDGIGKAKYTISYHDGREKHKDGSDFFGIQIFKKKKDLETFRKSLLSKGFVEESVNEAASRTAMEIGGLTGMNKDAIQKFVDDNKLDIEKVYQYVKNGKLPERMALVSAIAGKPGNSVQVKLIKKFK